MTTPTPKGPLAEAAKTHSRRCGNTVYAAIADNGEVLTGTTFSRTAAAQKAIDLDNAWGVAIFDDGDWTESWDEVACRHEVKKQAA